MFSEFIVAHLRLLYELSGVILLLVSVIAVAGALISRFDRIPLEDAIYFAFITAFTVGFGDVAPRSRGARVITVMLALFGILLVGVAVAVAVHALDIALTARAADSTLVPPGASPGLAGYSSLIGSGTLELGVLAAPDPTDGTRRAVMANAAPVLKGLNLVVKDMDATLAFYRRLGLDIPDAGVWRTASGAHHVEVSMSNGLDLDFDSTELARSYNAGWKPDGGARSVIGFSLPTREAVDERYAELTGAGYVGLQPPYDAFWGARYAIIRDPDGNHVGLMSPLDPARRSAPPSV